VICENCTIKESIEKSCKKLYDKARYKKNREKILAKQKEYASYHKNEIIEYHKKWYIENKSVLLVRHKSYKK